MRRIHKGLKTKARGLSWLFSSQIDAHTHVKLPPNISQQWWLVMDPQTTNEVLACIGPCKQRPCTLIIFTHQFCILEDLHRKHQPGGFFRWTPGKVSDDSGLVPAIGLRFRIFGGVWPWMFGDGEVVTSSDVPAESFSIFSMLLERISWES